MSAVALQSFGFGDQLVRAFDREGAAWFVGRDVCGALELVNSAMVLSRLDDDERDEVHIVDTIGRNQATTIVSESGVYSLIFTSRKPAAKKFRRWVTQEVLPAIRTTGKYEMPEAANDRMLDVAGVLGTNDDRHAIKTALLLINTYKDLYGQQAGRDMLQKLGFPVPGVELPPAPAGPGEAAVQLEGDIHAWAMATGVKASRKEATHLSELFDSYTRWCSATRAKPMHPDRFKAMMITIFNHEEHPEMIRAVVTRR